jgi:hypothetical protein
MKNMDVETIKQYKKFYFKKMIKYEWRYCTAFYLITREKNNSGSYVTRSLTELESKDYIQRTLSHIKRRLLVNDVNRLKRGIPIYAYYLICKTGLDTCFHAHIIMNIPIQYEEPVRNYIELFTDKELLKLETPLDAKRHILYMLRKGNFMVDSDNQYLLPTPYNLGVNRKHFRN